MNRVKRHLDKPITGPAYPSWDHRPAPRRSGLWGFLFEVVFIVLAGVAAFWVAKLFL